MRGEKKDVARPELFSGVIRYSRIEPSESDGKPDAEDSPFLDGLRVADTHKAERRKSGDGPRAATRISAAFLFVVGIAALGAGVTLIARSSFYSGDGSEGKKPVVAAKPGVSVTVAFLPQSGVAQRLAPRSQPIVAVPPGTARPVQPVAPAAGEMPDVAAATQPSLQSPAQAPAVKRADARAPAETVAELPDVAAATQPIAQLPAQAPAANGMEVTAPVQTAASAVKAASEETRLAAAPNSGEAAEEFVRPTRPTLIAASRVWPDAAIQIASAPGKEARPSNRSAPKLAGKSVAARAVKNAVVAQSVSSAASAVVSPLLMAQMSNPTTSATQQTASPSAAEVKPVFHPAPALDREPPVMRSLSPATVVSVETKATPTAPTAVAAIAPGEAGPVSADSADATPLAHAAQNSRPPLAGKPVGSFGSAYVVTTDIGALPVPHPAGAVLASIAGEAASAVEPQAASPGKKASRKAVPARPPTYAAAKLVKWRATVKAIPPGVMVAAGAPLAEAMDIASVGATAIVTAPFPAQRIDPQPLPAQPLYGATASAAIANGRTVEPLAPEVAAASGPKPAKSLRVGDVVIALAVPPVATKEDADNTPSAVAPGNAGAIRTIAEAKSLTLEPFAAAQSVERSATAVRSLAPVGELAELRPAEAKTAPPATPLTSADAASPEGEVSAPVGGEAIDAIPASPARMASAPATAEDASGFSITAGQVPASASQPEVAALSPAAVDDGIASALPEDIAERPPAKAVPESSQATKSDAARKPNLPALRPPAAVAETREKANEAAKAPQEPRQGSVAGWRVLAVRGGVALIDGGTLGVFKVRSGTQIPGVGKVHAIKQQQGRWTVITSVGPVVSAADDSGSAGY